MWVYWCIGSYYLLKLLTFKDIIWKCKVSFELNKIWLSNPLSLGILEPGDLRQHQMQPPSWCWNSSVSSCWHTCSSKQAACYHQPHETTRWDQICFWKFPSLRPSSVLKETKDVISLLHICPVAIKTAIKSLPWFSLFYIKHHLPFQPTSPHVTWFSDSFDSGCVLLNH